MKRLITLIAAICIAVSSWAYDFTMDGVYYNITSSTAPYTVEVTYNTIPDINDPSYTGDIIIPSSVTYNSTTYSISAIGHDAFCYSTALSSVTIPSSVTSIGVRAFSDCTGLSSIAIPGSVTSIEGFAFAVSGLTSAYIPASVTNLGEDVFVNCTALTSVSISPTAPIHTIGTATFSGCTGLTSVTLSDSITYIGEDAFESCGMLTAITIPNTVTYIGSYAFQNCTSLATINIPASICSKDALTDGVFWGCTGLSSIYAYSITPISLSSFTDVFHDVNKTSCVLHVPIGSTAAYQDSLQWDDFTNIVEDLPTAAHNATASTLKISTQNGHAILSGLAIGETITIYNLLGTAIYNQQANAETVAVNLSAHGVYVVRVGEESVKVVY